MSGTQCKTAKKRNSDWKQSNKQNGPRAEKLKNIAYIGLYGLIGKTIITIVEKDQENE